MWNNLGDYAGTRVSARLRKVMVFKIGELLRKIFIDNGIWTKNKSKIMMMTIMALSSKMRQN